MSEFEISVIVPMYNSSNTIERLLKSLENQNFKEFEIIFVDDASTDNAIEVCEGFLKKSDMAYSLFKNKENKGPSYSRNVGLKEAKGRYLVFIDSDDAVSENHLSLLYSAISSKDVDSAFIKGLKFNENDEVFHFDSDRFNPLLDLSISHDGFVKGIDLINLEVLMEIPFSFVFLIYDNEIIKNNDLKFNENFNYGEDTDFALRYLSHCDDVYVVDEYSYYYYQNEASVSSTNALKRFDSVDLFYELADYFDNMNMENEKFDGIKDKIIHSRIPKFIFGNMNYLFYNNYPKKEVFNKMDDLNLFDKLKDFKKYSNKDNRFNYKIKLFLASPNTYFKLWKRFKNDIY